MNAFAIFAVLFLAILVVCAVLLVKAKRHFQQALRDSHHAMRIDYAIQEEADWFGKTGLDESTERELAHYLRREFGERLSINDDALKASDLVYLGKFAEVDGQIHYWQIPSADNELTYAYVIEGEHGYMAWGDRSPPMINTPHP